MVNIGFGHGRDKATAIIDINEGGVSVALCAHKDGQASTIIAAGRSALTLEPRTPEQAIGMIAQQANEAWGQAQQGLKGEGVSPTVISVYAILHAPWIKTQFVQTISRAEVDVRVSDSMIRTLAQQALAEANEIDTSRIFEGSVVRTELNGYRTANPVGKYAHKIAVTSLVSDCDPEVKQAVESAIQTLFPVATVSWRSCVRAATTFMSTSGSYKEDYLFVDVGTDVTHIMSVREGLLEQRTVPEGVRTILARIAGGRAPDEVLGQLRMLAREACSSGECEKVESAMALAEPELVRIYGEALGQLASVRRTANDLLLVTHPDLVTWLSRCFSRIDFAQFTVTTLPFDIHTPPQIGTDALIYGEYADATLVIDATLVNSELD